MSNEPAPTPTSTPQSGWALAKLLTDRRLWRGPLPWIVALLVAANIVVAVSTKTLRQEREANLLLNTVSPSADAAPRFDKSVGENLDANWKYIPDGRETRLVIVAGMSQMYTINEKKEGDQTIVEWIDDWLKPRGGRAFGLAAPNLCNEEALLLLLATIDDPKTKPSVFLFGACFDKFRNVDLRSGYQAFLRSRPGLMKRWNETSERMKERSPAASAKMQATLGEVNILAEQSDDKVEAWLRGEAARRVPVIEMRQELNGQVQMLANALRNWVFNIKAASKRPKIESRYKLNWQFLGMMAEVARENGVAMVLYVNPLNPLAENPYVPAEYEQFKAELAEFCKENNIPTANLENVVPQNDWGIFMDGPDFKHFKGNGHRFTAEKLWDHFHEVLAPGATTRPAEPPAAGGDRR